MLTMDVISIMTEQAIMNHHDINSRVRVHVGNLLYDIDNISTVIDMNSNKPNIIIYVKEK